MFSFSVYSGKNANVTAEYIAELEKDLGIQFPEILKEYYMNNNADDTLECPFSANGFDFCVASIIPLNYGTMPLEKIMAYNFDSEEIPKTFIPLAEDIDSEIYYWDAADGQVYYLSVGNVEYPIPVCGSVEEFFDILNSCVKGEKDMVEYYPLGSVVLLKGGLQKLMIIARGINVKNGGREFFFDYGGVPFPEGLTSDQMAYFQHENVAKVVFEGFRNEEEQIMVENINRYLEENPSVVKGDVKNWQA